MCGWLRYAPAQETQCSYVQNTFSGHCPRLLDDKMESQFGFQILRLSCSGTKYRFSAFWLRSKCSICSYQLNIWYASYMEARILNWFLDPGGRPGLARTPPRVDPVLQYLRARPTPSHAIKIKEESLDSSVSFLGFCLLVNSFLCLLLLFHASHHHIVSLSWTRACWMCRVLVNREIDRKKRSSRVCGTSFISFLPSCGTHGARGAFKGNRFRLYMVESASVSSIVFRRRCCCCCCCCSATRRLRGTRSPLAYPSASSPCRTHSTTPPCVLCYAQHTQPSYRRTRTTYHQRLETGANSLLFWIFLVALKRAVVV